MDHSSQQKTLQRLRTILLVLTALVIVLAVLGYFGYRALNQTGRNRVDIVPQPSADAMQIEPPPTPDPFAEALATDVDYYESGEIQPVPIYEQDKIDRFIISILVVVQNGSIEDESAQTDMIFIVSYNQLQQKFSMLSIPRDTLVPIENYGWKRINAAYSYGGIGLLTNTINQMFDLDIQNYVYTGTKELAALADAVNGVPATLTEAEAAYLTQTCGAPLSAGRQILNGEQAVAYLLDRTSDDRGDLGRSDRQLAMLADLLPYLRNSFDRDFLYPFISTVFRNVRTNLDLEILAGIGYEMCVTDILTITTLRLPFDDSFTEMTFDGAYGILPEFEKNRILLRQALYGKEES